MNATHANAAPASTTPLSTTLGELVEALTSEAGGGFKAEILGDAQTIIRRIGPLDTQETDALSFLSNPKYRSQLADTRAACVIVGPELMAEAAGLRSAIVTPEPYRFFAAVTRWWAAKVRPQPLAGVHPSAVIAPDAVMGAGVHIGEHSAMAGCVGVAGSARIGKHCTVGGAGMILGHLTLADHVHVSSGTLISRSILKPGQYSGVFPFDENRAWEKNAATLRQLHALRDRIRALEKEVNS